jgi:hypothetical protein
MITDEPIPPMDIQAQAALIFIGINDRPTPDQLDKLAALYTAAKVDQAKANSVFAYIESQCVGLVQKHGAASPNAEKSRRLDGTLSEFMVTKSDTLTVIQDRVKDLKDALAADGHPSFFDKLFVESTKYEFVKGAADAFKGDSLPKRLTEKVLKLWGRCIDVKSKKPSLKVTLANPNKPSKRAKKAGVA